MSSYSTERKEAILSKLLPPNNKSVASVAREEGVAEQTRIIGVIKQKSKVSQCQVRNQHQINGHMKRSSQLSLKRPLYLNQN